MSAARGLSRRDFLKMGGAVAGAAVGAHSLLGLTSADPVGAKSHRGAGKLERFHVDDYGAGGSDARKNAEAIEKAFDDAARTGNAVVEFDGSKTYPLLSPTPGKVAAAAIPLRGGVDVEGNGATLRMDNDGLAIVGRSRISNSVRTHLVTDPTRGDSDFKVADTKGFEVSDEVRAWIGEHPIQGKSEKQWSRMTTVTSIDHKNSVLTLRDPIDTDVNNVTSHKWNEIAKVEESLAGVKVSNLKLTSGKGANFGLQIQFSHHNIVSNIQAHGCAQALIFSHSHDMIGRNISAINMDTHGHGALGRGMNSYSCQRVLFDKPHIKNAERVSIFSEFESKEVTIRDALLEADRTPRKAHLVASYGTTMYVDGAKVRGADGDLALVGRKGETYIRGRNIEIENGRDNTEAWKEPRLPTELDTKPGSGRRDGPSSGDETTTDGSPDKSSKPSTDNEATTSGRDGESRTTTEGGSGKGDTSKLGEPFSRVKGEGQ